jgi:hypothetical protein
VLNAGETREAARSALEPYAEVTSTLLQFRFGPQADIAQVDKCLQFRYASERAAERTTNIGGICGLLRPTGTNLLEWH